MTRGPRLARDSPSDLRRLLAAREELTTMHHEHIEWRERQTAEKRRRACHNRPAAGLFQQETPRGGPKPSCTNPFPMNASGLRGA